MPTPLRFHQWPLLLLLPLLVPLWGCRAHFDGRVYHSAQVSFQVGVLPPRWHPVHVHGGDLALHDEQGGTIAANALCHGVDDVPLDVLTNHLLFGINYLGKQGGPAEPEREQVTLAGRAALHTRLIGTLDGVAVALELYVLKKDGCTYDLQLVTRPADFAARRADFATFVAGFATLPAEKGASQMDGLYGELHGFTIKVTYILAYMGGVTRLGGRTVRGAFRRPFSLGELGRQIDVIGIQSIAIAVLTAIFSSMVMTVQFAVQMARFGAKDYVSSVVSLSLVRELGPVLTALLVGGRVGAGIAAELGSMSVTEQIDAIRSMGADPVRKLVVPRVLAGVITLPILAVLADVLGVTGAMVIARLDSDVKMTYFYEQTLKSVGLEDFLSGLLKTFFFGFAITLIACYQGLSTRGGTEGVGRATTQTVVVTSIVTLISDFILTKLLLALGL